MSTRPFEKSGRCLSCLLDDAVAAFFHSGCSAPPPIELVSVANGPPAAAGGFLREVVELGADADGRPATLAGPFSARLPAPLKYNEATTSTSLSSSLSSMTRSKEGFDRAATGAGFAVGAPVVTSTYSSSSSSSSSSSPYSSLTPEPRRVGLNPPRAAGRSSSRERSQSSNALLECRCFRGELPSNVELLLIRTASVGLAGGDNEKFDRDEVVRFKVREEEGPGAGAFVAASSASLSEPMVPRLLRKRLSFCRSLAIYGPQKSIRQDYRDTNTGMNQTHGGIQFRIRSRVSPACLCFRCQAYLGGFDALDGLQDLGTRRSLRRGDRRLRLLRLSVCVVLDPIDVGLQAAMTSGHKLVSA